MFNAVAFVFQVTQLTGFSDPVYAEAYVNVNQYDIVLDVLIVNQTSDTLQNLTLELATLGKIARIPGPTPEQVLSGLCMCLSRMCHRVITFFVRPLHLGACSVNSSSRIEAEYTCLLGDDVRYIHFLGMLHLGDLFSHHWGNKEEQPLLSTYN